MEGNRIAESPEGEREDLLDLESLPDNVIVDVLQHLPVEDRLALARATPSAYRITGGDAQRTFPGILGEIHLRLTAGAGAHAGASQQAFYEPLESDPDPCAYPGGGSTFATLNTGLPDDQERVGWVSRRLKAFSECSIICREADDWPCPVETLDSLLREVASCDYRGVLRLFLSNLVEPNEVQLVRTISNLPARCSLHLTIDVPSSALSDRLLASLPRCLRSLRVFPLISLRPGQVMGGFRASLYKFDDALDCSAAFKPFLAPESAELSSPFPRLPDTLKLSVLEDLTLSLRYFSTQRENELYGLDERIALRKLERLSQAAPRLRTLRLVLPSAPSLVTRLVPPPNSAEPLFPQVQSLFLLEHHLIDLDAVAHLAPHFPNLQHLCIEYESGHYVFRLHSMTLDLSPLNVFSPSLRSLTLRLRVAICQDLARLTLTGALESLTNLVALQVQDVSGGELIVSAGSLKIACGAVTDSAGRKLGSGIRIGTGNHGGGSSSHFLCSGPAQGDHPTAGAKLSVASSSSSGSDELEVVESDNRHRSAVPADRLATAQRALGPGVKEVSLLR